MILLFLLGAITTQVATLTEPSCQSKVFCQGDLLHLVQMARIFKDSKTFVDMKMIHEESITLEKFNVFLEATNDKPTKEDLKRFVKDNFEDVNYFETWTPPDWNQFPNFLCKIHNEEVKKFAQNLIKIWPDISRKTKEDVVVHPDLYTLIPVDNGLIIPGGRFREIYYWDTYWIIKGLLISEMYDTVKGMLENLLSLVERFGFIPNGTRIYYLTRSQPPLLNQMVAVYIQATNDTQWLAQIINLLDAELEFWLNKRTMKLDINDKEYELAFYSSPTGFPRPESYYEDIHTAKFYDTEEEKKSLYADLRAACESGHDFSSRWFMAPDGSLSTNLSHIQTRRIIPVDLNAFLFQAFTRIFEFYVILRDFKKARYWKKKADYWRRAIREVFYNEEDGIWYDWSTVTSDHRRYFFASNFVPLWAEAYDPAEAEIIGRRAADYFIKQGIMEFAGGIPASLNITGEQWDNPAAWPPEQSMAILGLDRTGNCKAKNISREFAHRWINSMMMGYNATGAMFEKYDADNPGKAGEGGEYSVQTGFGWTNGVALELIDRFFTT